MSARYLMQYVATGDAVKRPRQPSGNARFQKGVALFVGLVFLVILTLVALIAMRGTLLEMRMTTATARHERAFEASEAARMIPEAVLADHVFNRGWPVAWGGSVANSLFNPDTSFAGRTAWSTVLGNGLQNFCGTSAKVSFYLATTCSTHKASYSYTPSSWDAAFIFNTCPDGSIGSAATCSTTNQIVNTISIIRDGLTVNKGAGAAQAQGYASAGIGASQGGSSLLLQVRSDSVLPNNAGEAVTIAQYKLNISH